MPLDPQLVPLLAMISAQPRVSYLTADPGQLRAGLRALAAQAAPQPPIEMASVTDGTLSGPAGPLRIRTYRPSARPTPTMVFFHGGALVAGDVDTHDAVARKLASATGFTTVSAEYRLAPENPFPAALDDALAVSREIAAHLEDVGGLPERLVVSGDSAGGYLAAAVAQRFRDDGRALDAQLLLYPLLDPAGDYPSAQEYAEGYFLSAADIEESSQLYLGDHDDPFDPAIAPLRAADLSGLAPAVIGVAEFDPLRDQGLAYGDALRAAGVDVFARSYPGLIHAFGAMYHIATAADAALDELARELAARVPALQAGRQGR
jgi:acetyl esterase